NCVVASVYGCVTVESADVLLGVLCCVRYCSPSMFVNVVVVFDEPPAVTLVHVLPAVSGLLFKSVVSPATTPSSYVDGVTAAVPGLAGFPVSLCGVPSMK